MSRSSDQVNLEDVDLERTQREWVRYIAQGISVPERLDGVRQEVVDSWRRSQQAGARPFSGRLRRADRRETDRLLRNNSLLIDVAFPYLKEFSTAMGNRPCQITLAEASGIQLRRAGTDLELVRMTEQRQMVEGTDFSESSAGTNGIGTALALQKPVVILGPEHYHSMYQGLVCCAAPLRDGEKVVGCINITAPLETYDSSMMGMITVATHAIATELELRRSRGGIRTLWESEGDALAAAMTRTGGDVSQAAVELDVPVSTLYRKLRQHGISTKAYRARG
ncbi:MAG: helix-turn-helix domain-containing protein [Tractidigestivibacter sp.]|jgi:transcriptional regulator of acetoin/glycerol metabolism|uniref:helix-turn-helix domain-containing protein n=1 Tax=Tractidigestivibacter sp. TaxID=2847320 RepID=UPI003D916DC2